MTVLSPAPTMAGRAAVTGSAPVAPRRSLCIVIHDVAPPTWDRCRRLIDGLDAVSTALGRARLPLTLLAVPRYHGSGRDPAFERWLQGRAGIGDEVALHGYTHRDDTVASGVAGPIDRLRRTVYTRGEGEFWALDAGEATRRIDAGRAWLGELGLQPSGFVAPAWLLGPGARQALATQPFDYTCTVRRLLLLRTRRELVAQAQVYSTSTAWRRRMSQIWNTTLGRLQRADPVVRLELHPSDEAPEIVRSWTRLAREQAGTRRACTLAAVARELAAA